MSTQARIALATSTRRVSIARRTAAPVLAAWLGGTACGSDQAGRTWRVDPDPLVEIGTFDEPGPYLFESVRYGVLLPDGGLAVADVGAKVIRVFGPDGEFRAEMGGEGSGPGEFGAIGGLWLGPAGELAAWDRAAGRISSFDLDGGLMRSARVEQGSDVATGEGRPLHNLQTYVGSFTDGDVALASIELGPGAERGRAAADRHLLGRFEPDGRFRGPWGEIHGLVRSEHQVQPFSPTAFAVLHDDSLYVADGPEPRIRVLGGGGAPVRTIELPRVPVSAEDPWASLEAELVERDREMFIDILERVPRVDEFPAIGGLLADDEGLLWVKTYDPTLDAVWLRPGDALAIAPGGRWRVVRPDGEVAATLEMPGDVRPLDVRGDRILGVSRDGLDVERVVVLAIRRR